ncbi:CIA30 family protein [Dokdonella sp.]|uniref:CIA30 family protein n=1 Tax=Dokdonella sp. TaxID=2291710 RepID=UPI003C5AB41B
MRTLTQFDINPSEPRWVAVNDGVMGGRSSGGPTLKDGALQFAGMLSLENGGGFSSIRTVDYLVDLSEVSAVLLRVRGDGRVYQVRLATDAQHLGLAVSYGAEFVTVAGKWIEVRVGFDALRPSVRGTVLEGPPFDPSKVRQIGVLVGDKKEGPFSLEIDWIAVE